MQGGCVAVVQYRPLEDLPPVITLLGVLKKLGVPVFYIGLESSAGKAFLDKVGVAHEFLPYPRRRTKIARAFSFFSRRRRLLAILERLKAEYGGVTPWFQECHSAALAGDGAHEIGKCITTFFEFECNYGSRWIGFDFERMMRENVIVECEKNRAYMTQAIHGLKETPLVIANKPEIDRSAIPPLSDEAKGVFEKIGKRPVFMYQGYLAADRKDIPFILETIAKNRPDYCVLSLPGSESLNARLAPYPNAFTLKRIPAPGHLAVTEKATVGIAMYNGGGAGVWHLNALYCAPNKIYEYAAFGLPTLGNKIPGLEYTIGAAKAGICCDMTEESILAAADELALNIDAYRENARRFYKETDVIAQVKAVLKRTGVDCNENR